MRSKYNNKKTVVDGITFDSMKEARRYTELKLMEKGKAIYDLMIQPKFPIIVSGVKVCTYIADFAYRDKATSVTIIEDVKGVKTPVYNLKKKLMKAVHDIEVTEI